MTAPDFFVNHYSVYRGPGENLMALESPLDLQTTSKRNSESPRSPDESPR